jgi:hypothetical protein
MRNFWTREQGGSMSNSIFRRICLRAIGVIVLAFCVSSPALAATTFFGSRTAGGYTATYDITTDDTLGVLTASNIVSWNMLLSDGTNNQSFSYTPATFYVFGTALSSNGTDLLFNYDLTGPNFVLFYNSAFTSFLCIEADNCTIAAQGADTINMGAFSGAQVPQFGVQSIASIPPAIDGVPEPTSWAMMLLGFGAVGFAMRRRRVANLAAQAA